MDHQWPVQDAKQRFSELLRAVAAEGSQTVTRHGVPVAVVVPIDEYRSLTGLDDFKDFLRSAPDLSQALGERDSSTLRDADVE